MVSPKNRITHVSTTTLDLGHHSEAIELFITTLSPKHPVILGIPWLQKHDPFIHWSQNMLTFGSIHCKTRCLSWKGEPVPTSFEPSSNYQPPSIEEDDYEDESAPLDDDAESDADIAGDSDTT